MIKKIISMIMVVCVVLAMATCFASSGEAGFVEAITSGVTQDTLWGSVTPIAPIIIFMFIFAFSYGILRKVLTKGANKRKLGM